MICGHEFQRKSLCRHERKRAGAACALVGTAEISGARVDFDGFDRGKW